MPADMFLKLEPIKGESTDDKHKDEIEILSFSFGESNDGTALKTKPGKLLMNDFSFVTRVSRASPPLFLAVATGEHFKEAILTARKAGAKEQLEFLKWTLSDLIVTSYNEGGSASDLDPLDQFSLNFSKIEIEYKVQRPDGTAGETVRAGWDLAEKKAF